MCGIAGAVWDASHPGISMPTLDRMTDALHHRGPDGRGCYYREGIALGHRRLSIIDVDGGRQPLCNEDGTVWISFNGEIYNYQELRRDLADRGHQFRTNTDTETIVHLYEEHGVDCLQHLRGMFAFAIWDSKCRRLFLARDRLGQKPLVYHQNSGRLLFASEIKSILEVPSIKRTINPTAMLEYLTFGYVPQPHCMLGEIAKLPPAHYAIFEKQKLSIHRYWQPDLDQVDSRGVDKIREELRSELSEAVRLRLRSDVPLGAFLSGGIDSTAIVGLMQSELSAATKTFTVGFPNQAFDETPYAQVASDHLGTDHRVLQVEPASASLLPKLTRHFDEPFGDSSAIPAYQLAAATSSHVKVALTGDGGDELFGGYERYRTFNSLGLLDRLPKSFRRLSSRVASSSLRSLDGSRALRSRAKFRLGLLGLSKQERYRNWVSIFHDGRLRDLVGPNLHQAFLNRQTNAIENVFGDALRSDGIRAMQCDLQTYLPGDLLAKVDITSMANGLECRSPFLDHRVVELAIRVPFGRHLHRKIAKPMLSSTLSDLIPKPLQQRKKMGFSVPLDSWFRGPLREMAHDLLLSNRTAEWGFLSREGIKTILAEHESGAWNHGDRIWSLLCLEQWHREYVDCADNQQRSACRTKEPMLTTVASS